MLISAKINIQPISKVYKKNLIYQRILLDGYTVLIRLLIAEICEVWDFADSYKCKMLTSAKIFARLTLSICEESNSSEDFIEGIIIVFIEGIIIIFVDFFVAEIYAFCFCWCKLIKEMLISRKIFEQSKLKVIQKLNLPGDFLETLIAFVTLFVAEKCGF